MNSTIGEPLLLVEIRMASFHADLAGNVANGDLTRTTAGKITDESRNQLLESLRRLLPSGKSAGSISCHCAIPGTGVLLHGVRLPAASREETARLLRLRVESEFPLVPDELAWGYVSGAASPDGFRDFRLAAVRKEVLAEYLELFRILELSPVVSVAALARMELLPEGVLAGALLDVGPRDSELVMIESGHAVSIRGFPRGTANADGFDWVAAMRRQGLSGHLMVTGIAARQLQDPAASLAAESFGPWEDLAAASVASPTAAIAGLRRLATSGSVDRILPLNGEQVTAPPASNTSWPWRAIGLAAALLIGLLVAPYLEALMRGPGLARRVASIKADSKSLALIDREFGFLRHLESSQPPYIDALYLVANSVSPGTRIEATSMNRRGEVALRGKAQNMGQIGDLRSKLMTSGFFSSVVVEDQTQGQDRSVQFRLSARWKGSEERESLVLGPDLSTNSKPAGPKTNPPALSR